MGFAQSCQDRTLRIWPDSAEATLRFSAWLVQRKSLLLSSQPPWARKDRRIAVRFHDFDGEQTELPVAVSSSQPEAWLTNIPCPSMALERTDRLAIAKWTYPVDRWLDNDFVEKLI
jgi:hypothetical protein